MEIERIQSANGIELWGYEWDLSITPPVKINRRFLAIEQAINVHPVQQQEAICWSYGRTLGNIAVYNQTIIGAFPNSRGNNAIVQCEIVQAGLWQNGQERWWCRTHQTHWGKKDDIAAADLHGAIRCAAHNQPMSYVIDPLQINLDQYAEVGIWCSLPAALTSNGQTTPRRPKIHVHLRGLANGPKVIDQDYDALTLVFDPLLRLFIDQTIDRLHVTPPAAKEFVLALEKGTAITCVACSYCRFPHLDLGGFAQTPHRKHLCGNCGRDQTWTKTPSTSSPLQPIHDHFSDAWQYVEVERELNIDDYPGAAFALWASTPAIVWTANRPQERGIHVHLSMDGHRVIDDTFGTVIYQGRPLDRTQMLNQMIHNTLG